MTIKFHMSTTHSFHCRAHLIFRPPLVFDLWGLNGAGYEKDIDSQNLQESFLRPLVEKKLRSNHFRGQNNLFSKQKKN